MTDKKNGNNKMELVINSSVAEYLTFVASSGESGVEIRCEDENIWLTQKLMVELYNFSVRTISEHINKVFSDEESVEK